MKNRVDAVIDTHADNNLEHEANESFLDWLIDSSLKEEKDAALKRLWDQTGNEVAEDTFASFESLKLKSRFNLRRRKIKLAVWGYAAAIVLMVCVTSIYLVSRSGIQSQEFAEYFAPDGQMGHLTLPDGTEVLANSGAIILYSGDYGKRSRTVYLTGEANFKVKKNPDVPFIVKSKDISVTALGTEFDVSSLPESPYIKALLVEGSIRVRNERTQEDFILKPGEQILCEKMTGKFSVINVDMWDAGAWKRGELVFRGSTIREILTQLERKFSVSFQYKSSLFGDDKYNFRFRDGAKLPDILKVISDVEVKFSYKKEGDLYYITSK